MIKFLIASLLLQQSYFFAYGMEKNIDLEEEHNGTEKRKEKKKKKKKRKEEEEYEIVEENPGEGNNCSHNNEVIPSDKGKLHFLKKIKKKLSSSPKERQKKYERRYQAILKEYFYFLEDEVDLTDLKEKLENFSTPDPDDPHFNVLFRIIGSLTSFEEMVGAYQKRAIRDCSSCSCIPSCLPFSGCSSDIIKKCTEPVRSSNCYYQGASCTSATVPWSACTVGSCSLITTVSATCLTFASGALTYSSLDSSSYFSAVYLAMFAISLTATCYCSFSSTATFFTVLIYNAFYQAVQNFSNDLQAVLDNVTLLFDHYLVLVKEDKDSLQAKALKNYLSHLVAIATIMTERISDFSRSSSQYYAINIRQHNIYKWSNVDTFLQYWKILDLSLKNNQSPLDEKGDWKSFIPHNSVLGEEDPDENLPGTSNYFFNIFKGVDSSTSQGDLSIKQWKEFYRFFLEYSQTP